MNKYGFFLFLSSILLVVLIRLLLFFSHPPFHKDKESVRMTTRIVSEPSLKGKVQQFKIQLADGTDVYVSTTAFPQWSYGDSVHIQGKIAVRENEKGKVSYAILFPNIERNDQVWTVMQPLYDLRKHVTLQFERALPPDHAALLLGIVFGIKKDMSDDYYDRLQSAGVLHVIAASGMNVTMVAGAFFFLFTKIFHRRAALLISVFSIYFYGLLAGMEPSILRASIMASIAFGAGLLGRQYAAFYALCLTASAMVMLDPSLVTTVSFQLSFMATLGILFLQPFFCLFMKGPAGILIGGDIATTLSAQAATLPILLSNFGEVNILSVIINGLVLWTIPIVSIIGGLAGMVGLLFPMAGHLLLFLSLPFLMYFAAIVNIFANIPLYISVTSLPLSLVIGYYFLLLAFVLWRIQWQGKIQKRA